MNAFYVTVSIPLLLVLVGFNHAHGLTTFGKSNSGQGNNQNQAAQGKACTNQANCSLIKGTTCLRSFCVCGDNGYPVNGVCKAERKGHDHLCQEEVECVDFAACKEPKDKLKPSTALLITSENPQIKICQCFEGYQPTLSGKCSGASVYFSFPGLILALIVLAKLY